MDGCCLFGYLCSMANAYSFKSAGWDTVSAGRKVEQQTALPKREPVIASDNERHSGLPNCIGVTPLSRRLTYVRASNYIAHMY